jgi:phosphatidylglycerophosphate synthase
MLKLIKNACYLLPNPEFPIPTKQLHYFNTNYLSSMKNLPIALIAFRFALAPIIFCLAYFQRQEASTIILILMYLGLISDIFDGIVARNLNISTATLRRMDSQTDLVFWLSIGFATYFLHPALIMEYKSYIAVIFLMEGMCYAISIFRFAKETCTHALLAKMWGLSLLSAFTFLIGYNHAGVPFFIAIVLGLISHIDRILITLILPAWTHDIPSAYHAYLIRIGKPFTRNKLFN